MARLAEDEAVTRVVSECVRQGVTVSELEGPDGASHRSQVETAAGVVALPEPVWRRAVFPRLLQAMASAVRGSSGSRERVPRCRDCDQPVRWVTAETGKRLALDPLPHRMGNVARARNTRRDVMRVHPRRALPLPATETAYRPHWATCPAAAARRPKVTRLTHNCRMCGLALHPGLVALGYATHPNCDPSERVIEPEGRWSE